MKLFSGTSFSPLTWHLRARGKPTSLEAVDVCVHGMGVHWHRGGRWSRAEQGSLHVKRLEKALREHRVPLDRLASPLGT
jgi:hypothetical protein